MNVSMFKLAAVVGLMLCIFGIKYWIRPTEDILMPREPIDKMPMQLGEWLGRDVKLPEEIALATGASSLISRLYESGSDSPVSLHAAFYSNANGASQHSPLVCYSGSGFRLLSKRSVRIAGQGEQGVDALLTTWEGPQRSVRVLFWFQWGEYTFYDRSTLFDVQWKMRGMEQRPAVIKVLLETAATKDEDADAARLVGMGKEVFDWLGKTSGLPQPTTAE